MRLKQADIHKNVGGHFSLGVNGKFIFTFFSLNPKRRKRLTSIFNRNQRAAISATRNGNIDLLSYIVILLVRSEREQGRAPGFLLAAVSSKISSLIDVDDFTSAVT